MFDLHVHLAYVVASFVDGLDQELLKGHLAVDDGASTALMAASTGPFPDSVAVNFLRQYPNAGSP